MMMDGVPDVRAAEGVRPLNLSGKSTQQRGGDRNTQGSWPQASADVWAGHERNAWLGGHLLGFGDGQRQRGIAELTQRVIAAAQDFALHRQGGVLAVVAVMFGRQLAVVGVIGDPRPRRALGRLKRRPSQLR